ncbi:MAG: pimeloyl-ACP methyl ester esterase BioH [Chromatiales bacterium]|nr:pimeloyl-ACP methyl ester esterase BioH [Chromatiales bacterium]
MSLFVEQLGRGPDLVLLHGWGLHGGLFRPVVDALSQHLTLHLVDLPGHGRSGKMEGEYTLTNIACHIAAQVPDHATWLGWSLGGRVALQAASDGHAIDKLVLVGVNPCFVQRDDWPHAMPEGELLQVAESLKSDYRQTLQRFVAIQSRGSECGREELRALRAELFDHGEPNEQALAGGLEILRTIDLRQLLPAIQQQTLVLHGKRDTLAPMAAAEYMAARLPRGQIEVIEGAAHAPFLSHPDEFIAVMEEYLHG